MSDSTSDSFLKSLGSGSSVPLDLAVLAVSYRRDEHQPHIIPAAVEAWQRLDKDDLDDTDRFCAIINLCEDQEGYNFLIAVANSCPEGWHKNALLELAEFGRNDPLPPEDVDDDVYQQWWQRAAELSDRLVETMPSP